MRFDAGSFCRTAAPEPTTEDDGGVATARAPRSATWPPSAQRPSTSVWIEVKTGPSDGPSFGVPTSHTQMSKL